MAAWPSCSTSATSATTGWNDAIEWHTRRISYYQRTDWREVLAGGGFVDVHHDEVEWAQPMTPELVAARVRSVSYVADEPPEVQQSYVDRVLPLVAHLGEAFDLPYVTHVWWSRTPS